MVRNLLAYFGLYTLSYEVEKRLQAKDLDAPVVGLGAGPGLVAIEIAFIFQIWKNYRLRSAIAAAKGEESQSGFFGAAGITTVFNALT